MPLSSEATHDHTGYRRLQYLRHNGPEHVLAFAPTRSGKGVGLVIPTLLAWEESAVIFDIKGDLFMGRVVDGSLACDEIGDLERNIRSIVAVTFSVPKPSGQLRIFAIHHNELSTNLAAAS